MQDIYIYPALIDFADDGISIKFPDIPGCFSCAFSQNEIIKQAREALGLHLYNMEDDGDNIPAPTDILKISHEANQAVILVDVDMILVRQRMRAKNVNRMCTVPEWLDTLGRREKLNFSGILQEALIKKLGIKKR